MIDHEKVNVLMVDDHPENLLALEAILDSLGQNLVKAHSGEEALKCLLKQDFAVILLDVQMPGMDGFETATLIRQRERSRHTPIVFLTAFSTSDSFVFKGYSLGAVDYLLKPIEPEILKSKVSVFVDLCKKTLEVKRQATQLAAMNAELRESEERFRCLSYCSPVGILLTNTDGLCTYTNPRCQTICGFTLEESLGEGWLESVYWEDRARVKADWFAYTSREASAGTIIKADREHILTAGHYSNEFRCQTSEGIIRWVNFQSSSMLSDRGKSIGHVATIEDITDRKQAEEERTKLLREQIARQQAEAANRMKDEFLATLSHELRTPLNSILGWARLLRTRNFDEETTARALETIERNAKLQTQLIEDILDVSRIIRGKLRLNLCPFNLVGVIQAAIDAVSPQAEAKAIQLQTSLDPHPHLISGDPNRLQQIVWNLLSNAIKFTPEGGKVDVKLEYRGSWVEVVVSDTGIGIDPDFLPYVFDRFRQADGKTTRLYGGLGLGLAIVHHLVDLHGGTVRAESQGEGQGATFRVKLPLLVGKSEAVCQKNESNNSINSRSALRDRTLADLQVLLVDDEPDVRQFVSLALEEYGARVIAVASAGEAMKTLTHLQPDVLLSDIGMPEEDGYTLIRKVRDLNTAQGVFIPAAALTAYAREEDGIHALAAGFQMHLSKPVDINELVTAVAKLAGRAIAAS
ncbi:hybrid sensor histidine kinase/response regulator [Aerosakkonema funiforme]|uniref:Circadian input-output histidine kinase CikA n=1 Tax=Aerosakkonema funiforme FACHB-1375 TaxID=2949571 RepID=A0A926VDD8_9CYAN|nr:response regulator [Aerosakkonema funiforme]MBD2180822.1 response regulator [Aerosakkonema funiforme FACHB-1375]